MLRTVRAIYPSIEEEVPEFITVTSADGDDYTLPTKICGISNLIRTVWLTDQAIPLPNAPTAMLVKVIEFLQYYEKDAMSHIHKPVKTDNMTNIVQEWYVSFINALTIDSVKELLDVADYMYIPPLIDLCCLRITTLIFRKTPEDMRIILGISDPPTTEEDNIIRDANKWCKQPDDQL